MPTDRTNRDIAELERRLRAVERFVHREAGLQEQLSLTSQKLRSALDPDPSVNGSDTTAPALAARVVAALADARREVAALTTVIHNLRVPPAGAELAVHAPTHSPGTTASSTHSPAADTPATLPTGALRWVGAAAPGATAPGRAPAVPAPDTTMPDGQPFCLGDLLAIHTVGPYTIVEFSPRETTLTRFAVYVGNRNTRTSCPTLDEALAFAVASRAQGHGHGDFAHTAATLFVRSLRPLSPTP